MTQDQIPPAVRRTYGIGDLAQAATFAGGYINFGDWQGIDLTSPTPEDRVRSQQQLYRRVLRAFPEPREQLRLAEVGCGRGLGAVLAARVPFRRRDRRRHRVCSPITASRSR